MVRFQMMAPVFVELHKHVRQSQGYIVTLQPIFVHQDHRALRPMVLLLILVRVDVETKLVQQKLDSFVTRPLAEALVEKRLLDLTVSIVLRVLGIALMRVSVVENQSVIKHYAQQHQ